MVKYLDIDQWPRRELFKFFIDFDNPYFNICAEVDITKLVKALHQIPKTSISLTFHYLALRTANEIEPFRYRIRDGRVIVHDAIHGGTIVLLPNESFNFAYFNYYDDFESFIAEAQESIDEAESGQHPFDPDPGDNRIHFTVLPWVSFTSFAHARNWGREDSVPKIAFGKFKTTDNRTLLPISVEVHHALMDGLHVGRFLSRLEALLDEPQTYLSKLAR